MTKNKYKVYLYSFLFLILILAFWFRNHADELYGSIGDYYYKKDNIKQAQSFYEKAFMLGNTDYKLRVNYVNSIINSPLTVKSQEKLVKIAEGDVKDAASSNAEYFLYNLKREIHNKYSGNYILQAPYNQKIIHWGKMPITYGFKNPYTVNDDLIKGVTDAFNEWERVSSCRIKFKQVKINPDIWIEFIEEDIKSPEYGKKYVVAYTTPTITQNKLENMTVKLNIQDLEGNIYSQNQIYNTSLHEIFHALGFMGHSYDNENIMHMAKDNGTLKNDSKSALTYADKITLQLLYKIKPDITNANELEYNYVPYLILGDNDDINYTKLNEAKNYIRKAPNIPNGYIDLAEALVEKKRYTEAVKYLEKALRVSNNNDSKYIVLYNLAVANYYQGLYTLATDYINNAKEIKDSDELHFLQAEIFTKQNQTKDAIKEYEYLIHNNPQNIDYALNLANFYLRKHNYFKARSVLKSFLNKNPQERNNPKLSSYRNLFL